MSLPKVKFRDIALNTEIDWIHGFLFQNKMGWGKYIIKKHPNIKGVFSFKEESEQVNFLKRYITSFRRKNIFVINKNKDRYQKTWSKIEKEHLNLLSEIMDINWPQKRRVIKAMMSINPICPRFLNNWSFSIFYNYKKMSDAMEVIMHECCHFLYFEKWKEIYPESNKKIFESPYIEWHLSEIIAPIILNDKRIQKLLKQKAVFYEEHSKIKIGKKTSPQFFTSIYNKNMKKENGFELFLKESYKEIKKHKDLFK